MTFPPSPRHSLTDNKIIMGQDCAANGAWMMTCHLRTYAPIVGASATSFFSSHVNDSNYTESAGQIDQPGLPN